MADEDELNYVAVTFSTNGVCVLDKTDELVIYDEVKTWTEPTPTAYPDIREKEEKLVCSLLLVVSVCLGIVCVASVTAVIIVCVQLSAVNTVMSQLEAENFNLTAQNLQLRTQKSESERRTEDLTRDLTQNRDLNRDLTRDRDRLNWTLGVILDHDSFPVSRRCPHKVCKPCLDDWQLFQSNCYWFSASIYYSGWKIWEESRKNCREAGADLVVIDSKEEQEFISNNTKFYLDNKHGYWIGLKKEDTWTWVDGSNVTETYWTNYHSNYIPCALSLPRTNHLANWQTEGCDMRNRWICETRALIRPD